MTTARAISYTSTENSDTLVFEAWSLGASLYMPTTHHDLLGVAKGKYPQLRSLIYCTEDAILSKDLPKALRQLKTTLSLLPDVSTSTLPMCFVRVRNLEVLEQVLRMNVHSLHGLVLPKIHADNLEDYLKLIQRFAPEHLRVLPTLETVHTFRERELERLLKVLEQHHERIGTLRIGGNDLLAILGLRRVAGRTLYEGPLERVLSLLISLFKPAGFELSSPVFDVMNDTETLIREVKQDLEYGLCGKTIIHPVQLRAVMNLYRVSAQEEQEARAILAAEAAAVFQLNGRMCEPATHRPWAESIMQRVKWYGVQEQMPEEQEA